MNAAGELVDVPTLQRHLERPDWRLVDCRFDLLAPARGERDYRAGHLPGAVYAHLDRDLAAPVRADTGRHPLPDPAAFTATLRAWGVSEATRVVAYDAGSGALAARLWWLLRWLGHRQVALLDGGLAAWIAAGGVLERRVPRYPRGDFSGSPDDAMVIASDELAARLRAARPLPLVDAREPARFAGREEPIDAVAGHVPGALNFPFTQNLTADGRWRRLEELAALWRQLFDARPPGHWAVMCGSGVTACHLAVSAARAGLPPPRLYAGSWSEWIRDAGRPVAP